ncbi:MAG: hypothetical protein D3904_01665 [Candidatus Electrothrix sp. EH2]|nr:hypothetical protein [Candidatus Electrothrix sp. EH2]
MKTLKLAAMTVLALAVLTGCRAIGLGPGYGYGPAGYGGGYGKIYPGYGTCPPPLPDEEISHSASGRSESTEDCEPEYTFEPPGDYAGNGCIKLCQRQLEKCKEDARQHYESCAHFNKMAEIEFGRCVASGLIECYNNTKSCPNTKKIIPKCEANYRDCYTNCGGFVSNSCDVYEED